MYYHTEAEKASGRRVLLWVAHFTPQNGICLPRIRLSCHFHFVCLFITKPKQAVIFCPSNTIYPSSIAQSDVYGHVFLLDGPTQQGMAFPFEVLNTCMHLWVFSFLIRGWLFQLTCGSSDSYMIRYGNAKLLTPNAMDNYFYQFEGEKKEFFLTKMTLVWIRHDVHLWIIISIIETYLLLLIFHSK